MLLQPSHGGERLGKTQNGVIQRQHRSQLFPEPLRFGHCAVGCATLRAIVHFVHAESHLHVELSRET